MDSQCSPSVLSCSTTLCEMQFSVVVGDLRPHLIRVVSVVRLDFNSKIKVKVNVLQ